MMNLFRNDDLGKLVLRLALGVLMLLHGIAKVMNPTGSMNRIAIRTMNDVPTKNTVSAAPT